MAKRPPPPDSECARPKECARRGAFIMPELLELSGDAALFFCVLYRDLLTHLTRFVLHGVPYVSDPAALRCTLSVKLCRGVEGPHWPASTLTEALSHYGLPALLYMREPLVRCVRLFMNEECTQFADYDIGSWKHAVNERTGSPRRIFFTERRGSSGPSLYIVAGGLAVADQQIVTMEHVDVRTGRRVDAVDVIVHTDATFALSHDGAHIFVCESPNTTHGNVMEFDTADLHKKRLRTHVRALIPTGPENFRRLSVCPYGLINFMVSTDWGLQGLHLIRTIHPSGDNKREYEAHNLRSDEMEEATFELECCARDQRGYLYVPRITPQDNVFICVYAPDSVVCRVELPSSVPSSVMFLDMRLAAPNIVSLLYVDYDECNCIRFARCTLP